MRLVVVTLLLVPVGLLGWGLLWPEPPRTPSPGPPDDGPATAAEQRQAEILARAIDNAPDPALVRIYNEINTRHFGGRLPAMAVAWEPTLGDVGRLAGDEFTLEGMFGQVGDRAVILLHPRLASDDDALRRALSHEMVHVWLHSTGDRSTGHGPAFQAELKRLADEGAFAGLAAGDEERARLRAWLDTERARLDRLGSQIRQEDEALTANARALEAELARFRSAGQPGTPDDQAAAAWRQRRDAHNQRVQEIRTRIEHHERDRESFDREVERYNLMAAYPHGLDR